MRNNIKLHRIKNKSRIYATVVYNNYVLNNCYYYSSTYTHHIIYGYKKKQDKTKMFLIK